MIQSDVQNDKYNNDRYVKRNRFCSYILLAKLISTMPFNLVGLMMPEYIANYPWILFIEAFHHYHTRVVYSLALHRNATQLYCAKFSDGRLQRHFMYLEFLFDVSLVLLHVHEYFRLHNMKVLTTPYILIHTCIASASAISLSETKKIKVNSIA